VGVGQRGWVSTRDEARALESERLTCVDSAVPAEVALCLLLTEATEGHPAFGAGMPVEVRLAARIGPTAQRPVPPECSSHVGTRAFGVVHTKSGARMGCCRTSLWVEHPTVEQRVKCLDRQEAARRLEGVRDSNETLRFG
jgi:hypothetical protein